MPGGATQAFRTPPQYTPPAAPSQQGPSEYTLMMQRPVAPQAPPAPPQGQPPMQVQMQMPQMQMPQAPQMPQMPQAPQLQMPQAPQMPQATVTVSPGKMNWIVIAILCLLCLLAGALIVLLLNKHK